MSYTDKPDAIIFIHGNSSDATCWRHQVADHFLAGEYAMYCVDLPGHGASETVDNYRLTDVATTLRRQIEDLNIDKFVLVGHSLGTCIIGEMGKGIKGCCGIVLVSPNLTNNIYHPGTYIVPNPAIGAIASAQVEDTLLHNFAQLLFAEPSSGYIGEYVNSFNRTDGRFRTQLGTAIATADWSDQFENVLSYKRDVAIIFGAKEQVINTHYMDDFPAKWCNTVIRVAEAAHFPQLENPTEFNIVLGSYCKDAFS